MMQGSHPGRQYEVVDGGVIKNMGMKMLRGTVDGNKCSLQAQVCAVQRPLFSIKRAVEQGHVIVFDKNNSYMKNKKTGATFRFDEDGNGYTMKLRMAPVFARPESTR